MSLFVLDTSGNQELLKNDSPAKPNYESSKKRNLLTGVTTPLDIGNVTELQSENEKGEENYELFGLPPPSVDISNIIVNTLAVTRKTPSKPEQAMANVIQLADESFARKIQPKSKLKRKVDLDHSDFNEITGKRDESQVFKTNVAKELANSKMVPNLEQLKELPSITEKRQRELSRIERSKTKGQAWFNMPATELTEERENDLKILQMRSVLDPKHFYKKNDLKVLPKYFQIGTVQHSPLDYYQERDSRRNKKRTIVDELLADTETQKYIKRKHKEIMMTKQKYAHRKAMKKMKKEKKNK